MIFSDQKKYVCKFCGKSIESYAGSNTARLVVHLYNSHREELGDLKNYYLTDMVRETYDTKGTTNE